MAVKYGGLLKFTDEIKAEIDLAADGTVEKAVLIDGDGTETPIGGGGGGDFSTAQVTVVNTNTGSARSLKGANTVDNGEDTGSAGSMGIPTSTTETFSAILYKGVALINRGDATIVSVSGSAEKLGSSMVMVTGDCTITIS